MCVTPSMKVRSSLEEMLDALRHRPGNEDPNDSLPELPTRPRAKARTRLPSVKRLLPKKFNDLDVEVESLLNSDSAKEEVKSFRGNSFGATKEMEPSESPYLISAQGKDSTRTSEQRDDEPKLAGSSQGLHPRFHESEWNDHIGYLIKKVKTKEFFFLLLHVVLCFVCLSFCLFIEHSIFTIPESFSFDEFSICGFCKAYIDSFSLVS